MDWEQLLQKWKLKESTLESTPEHSDSDRAGVFWALLLLSAQSKVELFQEEFYQDLSIRPLNSCLQLSLLGILLIHWNSLNSFLKSG